MILTQDGKPIVYGLVYHVIQRYNSRSLSVGALYEVVKAKCIRQGFTHAAPRFQPEGTGDNYCEQIQADHDHVFKDKRAANRVAKAKLEERGKEIQIELDEVHEAIQKVM